MTFHMRINDPFTVQLLGYDVISHYDHSVKHVPTKPWFQGANQHGGCIHVDGNDIYCGKSIVEDRQHGWLCEEHYR